MRRAIVPAVSFMLLAAVISCGGPAKQSASEVQAVRQDSLTDDPDDASWRNAPVYTAELITQDLVEPRLMKPSTARLRVQALTDGRHLALRLAWEDTTQDDLPGASRFCDAVAIQIPRRTGPDVPAPQMGEEGRPVDITYWRASWQAVADGREESIRSLYPGATVDHYPFEAPSLEQGSDDQRAMTSLYAPARALGHYMEWPVEGAVEDLQAEGPGTLEPYPELRSRGRGQRDGDGWEVVIIRPLPQELGPGGRSQVAFAVWDGANGEAGSRKMRSVWVPLSIEEGKG